MYSKSIQSRGAQEKYEEEWVQKVQASASMQQHFNVQTLGVQNLEQAIEKNIYTKQDIKSKQANDDVGKMNDFAVGGELKQKKKGGIFQSSQPLQKMQQAQLQQVESKPKFQSQTKLLEDHFNDGQFNRPPKLFIGRDKPVQIVTPHGILDEHNNMAGSEFDLGKDGQFKGHVVVIGQFYRDFGIEDTADALTQKGFDVIVTYDEKNFLQYLSKEGEVGIIVSGYDKFWNISEKEFVKGVIQEHNKGKGIWLFGDNDPYNFHINFILMHLFEISCSGCDQAEKLLSLGDRLKKGHFGPHMITTGISNLYEGHTISYPSSVGALQVLATSTHKKPVICYADHNITQNRGRILLDTGFTKLYLQFDSAGTARYIVNAVVWLLDLDSKIIAREMNDAQLQQGLGSQKQM